MVQWNSNASTTTPRGAYNEYCVSRQVHCPMKCPEVMEGPWGKSIHPLPKNSLTFNSNNSEGMMYEAAEVRRCLNEDYCPFPEVCWRVPGCPTQSPSRWRRSWSKFGPRWGLCILRTPCKHCTPTPLRADGAPG
ncbi:hypothetical protein O3P69_002478 [Scylla paramamosain]|uniref:Uncharacterized protein n=1 Tax=Scylla paramamosain TaxID=85552 RepID=A0AAW0UNZ1_SCYPA